MTRIPPLSVFAQIGEFHSVRDRLRLPDHVVESVGSAMEGVRAIVQGKRIFIPLQGKAAVRNSIGVTANKRAEVSVSRAVEVGHISVEIIETEHHIRRLAVAVGRHQRDYDSAIGRNSSFECAVAQGINFHRSAIRQLSKRLTCHFCLCLRDYANRCEYYCANYDPLEDVPNSHRFSLSSTLSTPSLGVSRPLPPRSKLATRLPSRWRSSAGPD